MASRNAALQKLLKREIELTKAREADYKIQEQECKAIINRAIQQLSPQRRMVFTLSRMGGLSYDEIAQQLNLSRNTVRNTMAETLRSLRTYLHNNNINSIFLF
jgi:RNA polymerase sigma-70 factor (ECF subfamily)